MPVHVPPRKLAAPVLHASKAPQVFIGCSGWYYRHWQGCIYPAHEPSSRWFKHYQRGLQTVELNSTFYHWPKITTAQRWVRQAGEDFRYSLKVNQLITHEKRFQGTVRLVREFYGLAGVLGPQMGCFLFQLPPSFHYTPARLASIMVQLNPQHRSVVEFRHSSWWNDTVFNVFKRAGLIFCSVSAPRLPDELVRTSAVAYLRMHGARHWYRYDYSRDELAEIAARILGSGAREVWVYFNNDPEGCAYRNAKMLSRLVQG